MCVLLLCLLVLCACCFCCVFVVFCVLAGFGVYFAFVFAGFWLLLFFFGRAVYLLGSLFFVSCVFIVFVGLRVCWLWFGVLLLCTGRSLGAFGFWAQHTSSSRLCPHSAVGAWPAAPSVFSCFHLFSSFPFLLSTSCFLFLFAPVSSLLSWPFQFQHKLNKLRFSAEAEWRSG